MKTVRKKLVLVKSSVFLEFSVTQQSHNAPHYRAGCRLCLVSKYGNGVRMGSWEWHHAIPGQKMV